MSEDNKCRLSKSKLINRFEKKIKCFRAILAVYSKVGMHRTLCRVFYKYFAFAIVSQVIDVFHVKQLKNKILLRDSDYQFGTITDIGAAVITDDRVE